VRRERWRRSGTLVAVYDAGELDSGVFIAMELVEGETLARWLAERPRTWREIVRVFTAAGAGLVAAHAAGIVHRDFKPENVLVDRAGRVAVTDFGLAAIPAPEDDGTATAASLLVTRSGMLRGTPRYMAPEQFRGEPAAASSDQSRAVAAGELRPPPADRLVPRRVRRVVVRALAVAPGARFPAMTALRAVRPKRRAPRAQHRARARHLVHPTARPRRAHPAAPDHFDELVAIDALGLDRRLALTAARGAHEHQARIARR
jgi:serine/threonine protein kinase